MATSGSKSKGKSGPAKKGAPLRRRPISSAVVPKVLRIGIIQGGKIVEERIIRKRDTVSVGPSEKNTFVIATSSLPARYDLFEMKAKGGAYNLNFTEAMTGRISFKGQVAELDGLRSDGSIRRKGKVFQLRLDEDARGKIVIGESTVLFQFVAPPPIQPRPQLPAAVRGGLFKNIDWVIGTMWVISFLLHAGMITWWETTDWPVVSEWERYLQLEQLVEADDASFEDKKKAKIEEGEGEGEEEEEAGEEQDEQPQRKGAKREDAAEGPQRSSEEIARERAERRAELAAMAADQAMNKILGTLGGDGSGAIADVLRGGDVGADMDGLLSQVKGIGVATGDGKGALSGPAGGKGSGEAADISQLKMKGGDATVKTAGPGPEKKVKGTVKRKNPSAVDGTGVLSPSEMAKVITRRMGSIKGCYERALRRNPSLQGKVTIRFTVAGTGKVTTARATTCELTPDACNCMVSAFKRFRFPPPDGGSVTAENPFMFTPSN